MAPASPLKTESRPVGGAMPRTRAGDGVVNEEGEGMTGNDTAGPGAVGPGTVGPCTVSPRPPLTVSRPELLSGGNDLAFRNFVHRLLALSARLETCRAGFGSLVDLTGVQYTVLISIAHLGAEKPVGVKEIATHLGLSGAFVTIVTGQLIDLDLVDKRPNRRDRRRVALRVTDRGLKLLADLAPAQSEVNDRLFEPLSAEEFATLSRLVDKLVTSGDGAVALVDYHVQARRNPARQGLPTARNGTGR